MSGTVAFIDFSRSSARLRVVESTILVYLRSTIFMRAYPLMVGVLALILTSIDDGSVCLYFVARFCCAVTIGER